MTSIDAMYMEVSVPTNRTSEITFDYQPTEVDVTAGAISDFSVVAYTYVSLESRVRMPIADSLADATRQANDIIRFVATLN